MKAFPSIFFLALPFLFACLPKPLEIPLVEVPAGPLSQALDQRREGLASVKALASAELIRSGRKQTYEDVGIVFDARHRLRVEAFSPLGQSLFTLVGNGQELLLRRDDGKVVKAGHQGMEKIIGVPIDTEELCAALSGNMPASPSATVVRSFREPDGSIVFEQTNGDLRRRFFVQVPEAGQGQDIWITASERYRSDRLVYRVQYGRGERIAQYLFPKTVKIEDPARKTSITVVYSDVELNGTLADDVFLLTGEGDGAR